MVGGGKRRKVEESGRKKLEVDGGGQR